MDKELIAPCGMNCGLCANYLAMQNGLKKKGFHKDYCAGCRPRGENCTYMDKQCSLLGNGLINFCCDCADFPCRRLKSLDKRYRTFYHMSNIENLKFIKENGIESLLEREAKKWKCPECEGVISCHNGICFRCHPDDMRDRAIISRWRGTRQTLS
ncbi:MAG: DUF3795 domain-containing protein [Dehalococcoidaceae bacterium]|nr:DUF3795 domain-containing protein [Dehalococcoidaceae bacterium]